MVCWSTCCICKPVHNTAREARLAAGGATSWGTTADRCGVQASVYKSQLKEYYEKSWRQDSDDDDDESDDESSDEDGK